MYTRTIVQFYRALSLTSYTHTHTLTHTPKRPSYIATRARDLRGLQIFPSATTGRSVLKDIESKTQAAAVCCAAPNSFGLCARDEPFLRARDLV